MRVARLLAKLRVGPEARRPGHPPHHHLQGVEGLRRGRSGDWVTRARCKNWRESRRFASLRWAGVPQPLEPVAGAHTGSPGEPARGPPADRTSSRWCRLRPRGVEPVAGFWWPMAGLDCDRDAAALEVVESCAPIGHRAPCWRCSTSLSCAIWPAAYAGSGRRPGGPDCRLPRLAGRGPAAGLPRSVPGRLGWPLRTSMGGRGRAHT